MPDLHAVSLPVTKDSETKAPMTFRVNARAILELGAELISSDGVALYELLKNSVDAGATQVRIEVNVALRRGAFLVLRDSIDKAARELCDARPDDEANAIAELYEAISTALEEDAPAETRQLCAQMLGRCSSFGRLRRRLERFYDRANWISVIDEGDGMSLEDLRGVYLTIGTRSRQRLKPQSTKGQPPAKIYLGEKGVGRLSTMRLGEVLHVSTTKAGEISTNRLDVDWGWFSHQSDKLLSQIRIRPRVGALKADPAASGTTVTILRLASDWSVEKFKEIILEDFARLVDPFEPRAGGRLMRLFYNGKRHYLPEIEQLVLKVAHAECRATFGYDSEGKPRLAGFVNYRLRGRERAFELGEPELRGFIEPGSWPALCELGPFSLEFYWYNRRALTEVDGVKKAEIQHRVARWTGGLMLFRDGYRINPYGSAGDDWLGLDKRAFSSRGFKLNRQQVIGRVQISWRNPRLMDQTNREGLTETPEKFVFIELLQQVMFKEFKTFLDLCDKEVRVQEVTTLDELQEHVERARDDISRRIREVIVRVPSEDSALSEVDRLVGSLNGYITQAREIAREYESDRAKFVYLAGIGLMVEFILHELGRATNHTLNTLKSIEAQGQSNAQLPATFRTLGEQLQTIVKRIDTLDPLSTSRRQHREDFDVYEVIRQIVDARADQARRHQVTFEGSFNDGGPLILNGVRGMFIQIIENLLANSFYWLGIQKVIEPGFRARIEIDIDDSDKVIAVTDNGPGVDPSAASEIFEPFVSHRPARSGKGLGLYISREIATYHDWKISLLPEETIRKNRYNTFVLDISSSAR